MLLRYLHLENYIGIYNGLGLSEITIDFTKCKHNLLVIKGDNGSGKSSLFSTLHPLNDSNSSFIPKKQAVKVIEFYDDIDDVAYRITYIHGIKNNDERDTGKGYISKIVNNVAVELNPNGNISSCKDIVFSEFKLDANFMALTQLSSDDKGLVDKRPAERKRFVSSIISNLEVYNNIYKTISKRSSVFKSMINAIVSKIDSLGDEATIKATLASLGRSIESLEANKQIEIQKMADAKAYINQRDPDGAIQNKYNDLIISINTRKKELESIRAKIIKCSQTLGLQDSDNISDKYDEFRYSKSKLEQKVEFLISQSSSLLNEKDEEAKELQKKTVKLQSLTNNVDYTDLKNRIKDCKNIIVNCELVFKQIGIEDGSLLTKDEYITGLNVLKDIKESIDIFKSSFDYHIIEETITNYISLDKYPETESIQSRIDFINSEISRLSLEYSQFQMCFDTMSKLSIRPKGCKIDSCGFIKDAVEAFNKNPEENMSRIEKEISTFKSELIECTKTLSRNRAIVDCINSLKAMIRSINTNKNLINKLPIREHFTDIRKFISDLINGYKFEAIDILYSYIGYSNIFDEYKVSKETLYKLESDYKVFESKNSAIEDIANDINKLNDKISVIAVELESNNSEIQKLRTDIITMESNLIVFKELIQLAEVFNNVSADIKSDQTELNNIQKNISEIQLAISSIGVSQSNIDSISNQIKPMIDQRDAYRHGLALLADYKKDLEVYNKKYDKIETIKKYSSSTGGIQTVFIELYMNQMISIANKLLSFMFNGKYVLLPFIVNENDFLIPCKGSGLINDDISSMSSSERACISMIVSFALLYQASSKFNIVKLDEVDGALDSVNRRNFIVVLEEIMITLKCKQCIIISHNNELNLDESDVILLKYENTDPVGGNIIYKYGE